MDWLWMTLGFVLAAYSVVANDAIQTLGTFLASNGRRPWWVLWGYAGAILAVVLVYGWWMYAGDVSYGRLAKIPEPAHFTWIHVVPPLAILALTRGGVPVSTTFLVLTIFAPGALDSMLLKSAMGYVVAFVASIVVYLLIARAVEKHFLDTAEDESDLRWVTAQWLTTGFLWSQWLIQDLANVFVFLPRDLPPWMLVTSLITMLLLLGYTFYSAGGTIQRIVTSKTNTQDIRSAAIVNFIYALVLMVFKEWSNVPMSTTWVFLGLLAGRELAFTLRLEPRPMPETLRMVASDAGKAAIGLAVSVIVAIGLPMIAEAIDGTPDAPAETASRAEVP